MRTPLSSSKMPLVRPLFLTLALLLLLWPAAAAYCDCRLQGTSMHCSGCRQQDLPRALGRGVARLLLSGNRLTSLAPPPAARPALAHVGVLYADRNHIRELRAGDTCAFRQLRVLDLAGNGLQLVEGQSIACNSHLTRLVFSDNPGIQLGDLQSDSLTHLFLDRCELESLDPQRLVGLTALKYLYIRGNPKLACAATTRQLKKQLPDLQIYCDRRKAVKRTKTITETSTDSSTSASPESLPSKPTLPSKQPDSILDNPSSSEQPHLTLHTYETLFITLSVCFALILFLLIFIIFLFHKKCRNQPEIGTANGKLLEDPS